MSNVGVSLDKASPISMISAKDCASDIAEALDSKKRLVISPYWYRPILFLHKWVPTLVEAILIKVFAPSHKKQK
jgi:hypothetical protein